MPMLLTYNSANQLKIYLKLTVAYFKSLPYYSFIVM
jgi:hypothetical protein